MTRGSIADPPLADAAEGVGEFDRIEDAVFEEVADSGGAAGEEVDGVAGLDVLGEEQDPDAVPCRARIVWRRRSPSRVWVGGMRMSSTTTSGSVWSTRASVSSAVPACPTTARPAAVSSSTMPARSRTWSSATTTRTAGRLRCGCRLRAGCAVARCHRRRRSDRRCRAVPCRGRSRHHRRHRRRPRRGACRLVTARTVTTVASVCLATLVNASDTAK